MESNRIFDLLWRALEHGERLLVRRDAVVVFNSRAMPPPVLPLRIVPLVAADFGLLALRFPRNFTRQQLRLFERRFARGERGYIAYCGSAIVHTAWVAVCAAVQPSEVGHRCGITIGVPVSVIKDCWTPPEWRRRGIYSNVLRILAARELADGREVWIYCLVANRASRSGIVRAGFVPCAELSRWVWLNCLEAARHVRTSEAASHD